LRALQERKNGHRFQKKKLRKQALSEGHAEGRSGDQKQTRGGSTLLDLRQYSSLRAKGGA